MSRIKLYNTPEEKEVAKKLARQRYVEKNKSKVKIQVDAWYETNKKHKHEYYELNKEELTETQKEKRNIRRKKWYSNNKEKAIKYYSDYRRNRKLTDPVFKFKCGIRSLISNSLKKQNIKKTSKTVEILGCSFEDFKLYFESKFQLWMTWENHGLYNGELNHGWDIDHIIPLSSATCEAELIKLNNYTNLQPLCSKVNRNIKRNKIELSMDF